MLPDRSILIGQKLMEIAKIEKLKNSNETFFGNFQTMCAVKIPENSNILEL